MTTKKVLYPLSLLLCLSLLGCSGKGRDVAQNITGIAAVGAPISGGQVSIKGQSSCSATATTNSDGTFSLNVANCSLSGGFLVRVKSPRATIHTVAKADDVGKNLNVTPLTEIVAARTLGTNDLQSVSSLTEDQIEKVDLNFEQARSDVKQAIRALLDAEGVSSNFDIMSGSFSANGTGFDKVLNTITVAPNGSNMEITLKGTTGGTGAKVTIPADVNSTIPDSLDSTEIEKAKEASDEMANIRTLLSNISNCMKNNNKTCFSSNYATSDFRHNGRDLSTTDSDFWNDGLEISSTSYVVFSDPVLLEMNEARTEAHLMVKEQGFENGSSYGTPSYTHYMVAKEGGEWKLKGNQFPFVFGTYAALVSDNSNNVHRVLTASGPSSNDNAAITKASNAASTGTGIRFSIPAINVSNQTISWTSIQGYQTFSIPDSKAKLLHIISIL